MRREEGLGSTCRPKNTNEGGEATYASNSANLDIKQRHAEAKPTAKKE